MSVYQHNKEGRPTYPNIYMHIKAYEESRELPPRVVGCPSINEKLSNWEFSSRRSTLCSLSSLLVASSSSLVVLSSSSVENKRSLVVCGSVWVVCDSDCVVCSSDWVVCSWSYSWVTTGDVYDDDSPEVEPLALESLSYMDGPSLLNPYILPFLL